MERIPRSRLLLLFSLSAAFLSISLQFLPLPLSLCPFSPSSTTTTTPPTTPIPTTLFTVDHLSLHNGTNPSLPILLSILGSVFDVTAGRSHYGPTGSYSHFAGRDASRAFVSGDFSPSGLNDSLSALSAADVKSIVDWRGFFHGKYTHVGYLVGRYYDSDGNPTKHVRAAEAKAKRGKQLEERVKEEEKLIPTCNSRWSQDQGGEVWCDDGADGGTRYPRLMAARPDSIALTGKMSKRCVCLEVEKLEESGLEVYEGCDSLANRCKV